MADIAQLLDGTDDVSRVTLAATTRPGHAVVQATIHPRAVDEALQSVRRLMLAAGLIASYGVIEYNEILIVGAMAISPDLLPITAVGVGLVDRRLRLATRALLTLVVGMAFASV